MSNPKRALRLVLAASVALTPAQGGTQEAGLLPYFRYLWSASGVPGARPDKPDDGTVRGDGDLAIYAPLQVRARPGVPFHLAFYVENAQGGVAWSSVGADLPPGLSLDPGTGVISGRPTAPVSAVGVIVQGVDGNGAGKRGTTKPFRIDSVPVPVVAVAPDRYEGIVGKSLSVKPSATNLYGSQAWRVEGVVPGGLTFDDDTGEIKGFPAGRGSYRGLSLTVVDGDGAPGTSNPFDILVEPKIEVTGVKTQYFARVGKSLPALAPIVTGGSNPIAWSVSAALPTGVAIDERTGQVTGTPSAVQKLAGISVKATDTVSGEVATAPPFTFETAKEPVVETDKPSYEGRVGKALGLAPKATGLLRGGYWSVKGVLPTGTAIATGTGAVSGTPLAAGVTSGVVFKVTDLHDGAVGQSPPFPISIYPELKLGKPLTHRGSVGAAYALQPPRVKGLVGTAAWSVAGALPAGLTVDPVTGEIKGAPTLKGTARGLSLRVVDSKDKATASSDPFDIEIVEGDLAFSVDPLEASYEAPQGRRLSIKPGVTGARGAVAWSVAGTLPPWAYVDPATGEISGLPDDVATYPGIQVQAQDGVGGPVVASTAFTISSTPPDDLPSLGYPALQASVDDDYESPLPTVGGAPESPVYSLVTGPLPAGLTVDGSTGRIAGKPTVGGTYRDLVIKLTAKSGVAVSNPFTLTVDSLRKALMGDVETPVGAGMTAYPYAESLKAPVTWSSVGAALPAWVSLDAATGLLSGEPPATGATENHALQATGADGRMAKTDPFRITVTPDGELTASMKDTKGVIGRGMALAQPSPVPSLTGQKDTPRWYLAGTGEGSGALPAGVTVDEGTGALTGTPTEVGVFPNVVLKVYDGARSALTPAFTVTVDRTSMTASLEAKAYQTHLGTPFETKPPLVNGALGEATWTLEGTAPGGLAVRPADGVMAGTSTALGKFGPFALTSHDIDATTKTTTQTFGVEVLDQPGIDPIGTLRGKVGTPMAAPAPKASDVAYEAKWSLAAGTLPRGLSVDAASGKVTGTPSGAGTTGGLRLKLVDKELAEAVSDPFDIVVEPGLAVTAATTKFEGMVGEAFTTQPPGVTNSNGDTAWVRFSGSLPPGTQVTKNGTVAGIPTGEGVFTFSLQVRDADGTTGETPEMTATISRPLRILGLEAPPEGRVGVPYPGVAATSPDLRGTPTWSATGLPPGLAIDAAGKVAGTPGAAGATLAEVKLADSVAYGKGKAKAPFKVLPEIKILNVASPMVMHEKSRFESKLFGVTGIVGTPAWSGRDNVPAWLAVDPGNGRLSGTPPTATSIPGVTIQARDSHDQATGKSDAFTIQVLPELAVVDMATNYSARFGYPFKATKPTLVHASGKITWAWGPQGTPPAWLRLDPANGEMTGTPDATTPTPGLMITGSDETGAKAFSVPFDMNVYNQMTVTLDKTVARVRIGDLLAFKGQVEGLVNTATWALGPVSGTMPGGLGIDASGGTYGGTVGSAGAADFTLVVTDSYDGASKASDAIRIEANPVVAVEGLPDRSIGRVGKFMDLGTPRASNVHGAQNWDVAPKPDGLLADAADGRLSGIPTKPVAGQVAWTVQDAFDGAKGRRTVEVLILDALAVKGTKDLTARTGVDLALTSFTPSAGPAAGTVSWSLGAGTLPNGVSVEPATGRLVGRPVGYAARTEFPDIELRAQDVDTSATNQAPFTVTVHPSLSANVAQQDAAAETDTETRMDEPVAVGALGVPSWSVTTVSGTAPRSLSVDGKGVVTFTADAASIGTWAYRLVARDPVDGSTASTGVVSVALTQKPYLTYPAGIAARVGADIARQNLVPTKTGLRAPLTYEWDGGPGWASVDIASGALVGTASGTPGTSKQTVTVTDADGKVAKGTFDLTVNPGPKLAYPDGARFRLGLNGTATAKAENMAGPTTYAVVGVQPAWPVTVGADGTIAAKPTTTACPATWSVKAVDGADQATATATPDCEVAPGAFSIGQQLPASGTYQANQPVNIQVGFANKMGEGEFTATGLPGGLSIDAGGAITGTPTLAVASPTPYRVTVTARDKWDNATAGPVSTDIIISGTAVLESAYPQPALVNSVKTSQTTGDCTAVWVKNTGTSAATGIGGTVTTNAAAFRTCAVTEYNAASNCTGMTMAVGGQCWVGVQVTTSSTTDVTGAMTFTAANAEPLVVSLAGKKRTAVAAGSKLFTADGAFTPPVVPFSFRYVMINGGGSGYNTQSLASDAWRRNAGFGGNGGRAKAYFGGYTSAVMPVVIGQGGIATWDGSRWVEGPGGQTKFGTLTPGVPAKGEGGSVGGGINLYDGSGATAGKKRFGGLPGKAVNGAAESTAPVAGDYGNASVAYPSNVSYTNFQKATVTAPSGGAFVFPQEYTGGCGVTPGVNVYAAGSMGGHGITVSAGASASATAGAGTYAQAGGTGFGAGGGGPGVTNCTPSQANAPGKGAPGMVYIEWDAQ